MPSYDAQFHIERKEPEELPALTNKVEECYADVTAFKVKEGAPYVEAVRTFTHHYQELMNKVFKLSPYGVYCFTCNQPLQNYASLDIDSHMLRGHCNRQHKKYIVNLPKMFWSDMAGKFSTDIQLLQKRELKKEALVIENGSYVSQEKDYCGMCNNVLSTKAKHSCGEDTVEKIKCYRSWCKRWVVHWDKIFVHPNERSSCDDNLHEILQGKKKSMEKLKLVEDPKDTRPLFTNFYLNTNTHLSNNTMTLKEYVTINNHALIDSAEELLGQKDRKYIENIEHLEGGESKLFKVIKNCPQVKEAKQVMEALGYYKHWYYVSYSLLWNQSGNMRQAEFHFDYKPPTKDDKEKKVRAKKQYPRGPTDQGSSLLIALDNFALDMVLNNVIKRINVVEGSAIAFTNKLWHRGAYNPGPDGWRLFMYSSPDPLDLRKSVWLRRDDSTDSDVDEKEKVKKPAAKKQRKK